MSNISKDIKSLEALDSKISSKEKEIKSLKTKRNALQTKIITSLMSENQVKLNDLISYFESLSSNKSNNTEVLPSSDKANFNIKDIKASTEESVNDVEN